METILAIDQSTSATKALLFSSEGDVLDQLALEHQQHYPQPGWVEHDADEIYQNTLEAARSLLARNRFTGRELSCLSITNQRETIVVFDRATGRPLYPAIVWQCRRGAAICLELISAGHEALVHAKTGLKIDTYFPASKLTWLLREHPELKGRLEDGSARIGAIDTYLIYRLTNGAVFATDHSNASRTLLFNIKTLAWDAELCQLFGIPLDALPGIQESSAQYGQTDLDGALSTPLTICGVMGDSQAALFAQGCTTRGQAKVTVGTGSSLLMNIGETPIYSQNGILTAIGWVIDGKPIYAFEGLINYSGATIAWLRDQLELIETAAESEQLATSVEDNDGVYFVPAFVGLNAPYWRADIKAAIVGLSPSSTKAHVVRAALESIAFQIKDALALMADEAATDLASIRADGGAVRNRFLMQLIADLTGITVYAAELPELSALGAVFAGLLGLGFRELAELEGIAAGYTEYRAAMSAEAADRLYAGWQAAVQQVL